ncbi:MAG: hypothetical protein A2987_00565 [Omnitrophica bacterium RIFCSPLOWO2_01_FULL_45_10]|nr:MAG: hypothetical protein A2987_00565 [Omnitrophica bacterium RIFCSPLOWO2_01_FULL_45_10]
MSDKVSAVILVGGKGKRLRPLSTDNMPKAFLSVTRDRKTMFRKTLDRILTIVPERDILVVANTAHSRLVKRDFPFLKRANFLLEPVSRNTAPAITLAALRIKEVSGDAIIVVLPTDQYVTDKKKYLDSIRIGIDFVKKHSGVLLVLAVKPKGPATGFGYLRVKGGSRAKKSIYKVEEFVEKPDVKTAKRYVKSGRYLWNAGGFIFRASSILRAVERLVPKIFDNLRNLKDIQSVYMKLPNISIDYAVMEKADNIYCVKGLYGWRDMGSFESLKEILEREGRKYVSRGKKIVKIL